MFIKATKYFYTCVNIRDGKLIGTSVNVDKIPDIENFIAGKPVELKGSTKGIMRSLFTVVPKKDIVTSEPESDKGDN